MRNGSTSDGAPAAAPSRSGAAGAPLAAGAAGLASLAPLLAWRGEVTAYDAALALAFSGLVASAALGGVDRRARATAGAARGVLVGLVAAAAAPFSWPLALLVAAEAALAARMRATRPAALAGALAALPAAVGAAALLPVEAPAGAALAAALVLLVSLLPSSAPEREAEGAERSAETDALLESACDLVTWHDAAGDVLRANGAAARIAGAPPRALKGGGLLSRVHVSDRPAFLKTLSDVANGGDAATVEYRLHAGASPVSGAGTAEPGRVAWAQTRAVRLPAGVAGADGSVVVAFTRDESIRRRHEEELERARAEAERANEMKGRFLATVSHELRTPLNAIIGFSELLGADHPFVITEERRKEYANIIKTSGHHLLEIVNTLLDMSKIEAGEFAFEPEPFSFKELAESCCDLMQIKSDVAGLTLVRRLEDAPAIVADRRACRQILINLLSNAVKFTPAGGAVTVSLARTGGALSLAVTDTGIGIGESDLPRLGDPFFQAGAVHGRSYEGTGLGLSVVRGLVGLHGGSLSIESGAGEGTTVTVVLPLAAARGGAAGPATVRTLPRRPARALPDRPSPDRISA